jgi:SHAQKYF class myb-like DNA-binding protein
MFAQRPKGTVVFSVFKFQWIICQLIHHIHRKFLMGLKKYSKGDWRNISHDFVTTRTPTQVASHAQKYFIRQLNGGKDRGRSSIHDITMVNLHETKSSS